MATKLCLSPDITTDFYLSLGFTQLDSGGSDDTAKMFLSIEVINQLLG